MISIHQAQSFLFLWALVEVTFLTCNCSEYFATTQTFSNFVKTGTVHVAFDRADLVLEIDLHSVTNAINRLCRLGEVVSKGSNFSLHVARQIELLCEGERSGW